MSTRISHSRLNVYKECSKKYYFKYVEKWESPEIGSALFFGVAIDETLNYVLECKMKNESINEDKMWEIYDNKMMFVNNKDIRWDKDVYYFNSDVQLHLLSKNDIKYFDCIDTEFNRIIDCSLDTQNDYVKKFKESNKKEYQYLAWTSLYRKGELFLRTYLREILPHLTNIFFVQDNLMIDNGEGDILICKPDFGIRMTGQQLLDLPIVEMSEETRKSLNVNKLYTIVMDNKTSANPYPADAVKKSEQLHTYSEFYGADLAGYIVLNKKVNKTKKLKWQIQIDEIDPEFQTYVFDMITDGLYNMKREVYNKNTNSCMNWGRRCPYYNLCFNNDERGLYKREKK